jgi:hypothetical protein
MITSIDIKQRILWLSDIHYLIEYKKELKDGEFKCFLSSFLALCKSKNEETAFDYVLISGDIAQSGEKEEYKLFKKDILDKIFEILPDAKLLVIPGNHDVSRKNIKYFDKYFNAELSKHNFLENNPISFDHIFKFYKEAFVNHPSIPKKASENYKLNLFHGFVKDDNKKTFFVLLNSSWFSFGYDSLIHYINSNLINNKNLDTKKIAKEITQRTQEYGNQIVGMNVFEEFDNLKKHLKNYPEYFVITVMHHPINWLKDVEQINYNDEIESPFFYLREKTNLLLTGHEHVPHHHLSEMQNNQQTIHIPAGPFIEVQERKMENPTIINNLKWNTFFRFLLNLFDKFILRKDVKKEILKVNTYKIEKSMFSILDINIKKNIVINNKFVFKDGDWKEIEPNEFKIEKNHSEKLTIKRKELLLKKIDRHIANNTIILKLYKDVKLLDQKNNFFINEKNELFIFVEKKLNSGIEDVKKVVNTHEINIVNFVFIDIKFDNGILYETKNDRFEVLNEINNGIEFDFNDYRHNFFTSLSGKEVLDFKKLKFVLIIKPFWEIDFLL